jgi:hypothetical protein
MTTSTMHYFLWETVSTANPGNEYVVEVMCEIIVFVVLNKDILLDVAVCVVI